MCVLCHVCVMMACYIELKIKTIEGSSVEGTIV